MQRMAGSVDGMGKMRIRHGTASAPCGLPEAQQSLRLVGKVPQRCSRKWVGKAEGKVVPAPTPDLSSAWVS